MEKIEINLPYDKGVFNNRIGYITTSDIIVINGTEVTALDSFNIYKLRSTYGRINRNKEDELNDFVDWLIKNNYVVASQPFLEEEELKERSYTLFRFYPSYKDVLWVARVLQTQIESFTTQEILLLALYRGTEIKSLNDVMSIDSIVIKRELPALEQLIKLLTLQHVRFISNELQNN
jgi:hypothetical protein